jgi:hypothetical protein
LLPAASKALARMGKDAAQPSGGHGLLLTVLIIVAWYTANIALLLLNKFLLSSTKFRQPVFLSFCHMFACLVMGLVLASSGYFPLKPVRNRMQLLKISALASIFCATIVSSCFCSGRRRGRHHACMQIACSS